MVQYPACQDHDILHVEVLLQVFCWTDYWNPKLGYNKLQILQV